MRWRDYLVDRDLAEFSGLTHGGARMLVRLGYEPLLPRLLRADRSPEDGIDRVAGGREPHALVALPGGERAMVRRYRRGGAMRHLNRGRYFLGHRAFHELRATERARAAGVRVPILLAAVERRGRIGYTAALVSLWIEGAMDLSAFLSDRPGSAAALEEAGRQVAAMHDAGIAHPDLNLRNLLVVPGPAGPATVYLLDFDRARIFAGPAPVGRRRRDLARLARSARKVAAPLGEAGWAAFRAGYGPSWPASAPPPLR